MIKKILNSKLRKDLIFSYFTQAITLTFGFLNIYLITNYVGLYKYGQYSILVTSVGFMSLLITARSGEAIVKFYKKSKIEKNNPAAKTYIIYGFFIDVLTSLFLYGLVILLSDFIASSLLKDDSLRSLVTLFAIINVLVFLKGTMQGYLQAKEMFYFFNGIKIFEVIGLSVVLFFSFKFLGTNLVDIINSYIFVYSLSFFVSLLVFCMYYFKEFKSTRVVFSKDTFVKYIKFNMITFTSSTMKAGSRNFDNLILSYFTSPSTVAIYTILKKFFMPISMISKPFRTIMYPKLTQFWYNKKYIQFQNNIMKITKLLLLMSFVYFIGVFVFSDLLINSFKLEYENIDMMIYLMMAYFSMASLTWWTRNFSNIVNPMYSLISSSMNTGLQIIICPLSTYFFQMEGLIISLIFIKIINVIYWLIRYKSVLRSVH